MRTFGGHTPSSLYVMCLKTIVGLLRNAVEKCEEDEAKRASADLFQKTGIRVASDLMIGAFFDEFWTDLSRVFTYLRAPALVCVWDPKILNDVETYQTVKQILLTNISPEIDVTDFITKATKFVSIDLDGELFWRSYPYEQRLRKIFNDDESWLSASQNVIRILYTAQQKIPSYISNDGTYSGGLHELHLGTAAITVDGIIKILRALPQLILLRSYKLVKAIYKLHAKDWKKGKSLTKYQLRNLDADFSYVGSCTLTVERMLPMDALQLAVEMCPRARFIRVRFDCSSHHDILQPLVDLNKVTDLSVVCVTNGERSLLDFVDIEPVLRRHGEKHLKFLELKVIDEVDVHKIINACPKLETLVLSGNDYVTPKCSIHCLPNAVPKLRKLKILFFAEGGDIVSKNYVPPCFWYSTLLPFSGERNCRLRALLLESPRISVTQAEQLFGDDETAERWPHLQVLYLSEYHDISVRHLMTLTSGHRMRYLRISRCQKLTTSDVQRWQRQSNRYDIFVHVN